MGKNWQHTLSGRNSGCVGGVLHVLKYHQWRYVKKGLPHRRRGSKHDTEVANQEYPTSSLTADGTLLNNHNGKDESKVGGKTSQSSAGTRGSIKGRLKALISDELSRGKGRHGRSSGCPVQSPLMHTDAPPRKDAADEDVVTSGSMKEGSPTTNIDNAFSPASSFDPLVPKSSREQKSEDPGTRLAGDQLEHNWFEENEEQIVQTQSIQQESDDKLKHVELQVGASAQQAKEVSDALYMINMNKELFLRMLRDPGSPLAYHFHNQHARSKRKTWYSKSVSFPSPLRRGSGSNKHKQKEGLESCGKEGRSQVGGQAQISIQPKPKEYVHSFSMPSIAAGYRADGILKLNQSMAEIAEISSSGSSLHLKSHGRNQVASNRFKNLKQRIKHVIKESKKEKRRITMDGILHKIPYSNMFSKDLKKEIARRLNGHPMSRSRKDSHSRSNDSDYCLPSASRSEQRCVSRTSSLSESLDKYQRLYESSLNREDEIHGSESFVFRKHDALPPILSVKKTMGRMFSMPDLRTCPYPTGYHSDAFSSSQDRTAAGSTMSLTSDTSKQKSEEHPTVPENMAQLDASTHVKSDSLDDLNDDKHLINSDQLGTAQTVPEFEGDVEVDLANEDLNDLMINGSMEFDNQDIQQPCLPVTEPNEASADLIPESKFLEVAPRPASLYFSQGIEVSNAQHDSLSEQSSESCLDAIVAFEAGHEKTEFPTKLLEKEEFRQFQVEAKDKAEFNYVRRILELSGFSGTNHLLGTWHSDDRPLDPSMYQEMEGCCLVLDPECSANEEGGHCHHLILFDLINEVLMEIYSKSYSYYPKQLSSLSHISPMPKGHGVLEEVWGNISWHLSSCPDNEHFLDYAARKDLVKSDGWMNLQFDSECVGLELEELIFNDLVEELLLPHHFM